MKNQPATFPATFRAIDGGRGLATPTKTVENTGGDGANACFVISRSPVRPRRVAPASNQTAYPTFSQPVENGGTRHFPRHFRGDSRTSKSDAGDERREHPIDRAARLGREAEGDSDRRFRTPDERIAYLWERAKRRAA